MKLTKRQIALIVIGLLLLLFTPLWVYMWKFAANGLETQPEKWGTFGDFIGGILNPIIALLTLGVTAYIAYELKKFEERNSEKAIATQYMPQLVIQREHFYLYSTKDDNTTPPTEFSYEPKAEMNFSNTNLKSGAPFGLNIYNIGLGSAKKIQITFELDIKGIEDYVNDMNKEINQEKRIDIKYKPSSAANRSSLLSIDWPIQSVQFVDQSEIYEISHLPSINVAVKPYTLLIPNYILNLYRAYFITWCFVMEQNRFLKKEFPPFYVTMHYSDIGDEKFDKRFKVNFSVYMGGLQNSTHELKVEEV